jgi:hypothetical protein
MPDDREARLVLAALELAQEMRTLRGLMPAPGGVGELTLMTVTNIGG